MVLSLKAGEVVQVGNETYTVLHMLGTGSFGSVAQCMTQRGGTVALKVVPLEGDSTAELEEVKLHQKVTQVALRKGIPLQLPRYRRHSVHPDQMLLVMDCATGGPLDVWLYGFKLEGWYELDLPALQCLASHRAGFNHVGLCLSQTAVQAGSFVLDMFKQLFPTMAVLNEVAMHRDISSHNVMYDETTHTFTLIDLGVAVAFKEWSQGGWRTEMVSGDVRYWPPTSWMNLLYGPPAVEASGSNTYARRLDMFAFGILGMEVFFHLWQDQGACALVRAKAIWWQYTQLLLVHFQAIMLDYESRLDLACAYLDRAGVGPATDWLLQQLLAALSDACIVHPDLAPLLRIFLELLDGQADWKALIDMTCRGVESFASMPDKLPSKPVEVEEVKLERPMITATPTMTRAHLFTSLTQMKNSRAV